MENLDFNGTSDLVQKIESSSETVVVEKEEKKVVEQQMMEFSSSVDDLVSPPIGSQDVYTNPTNGRVAALSLPAEPSSQSQKRKSQQNPFNLTDEQFNALLAGVVAVIVFSTVVQTKLAGLVPNFSGINGNIASALVAAAVYYFAYRFVKNR